MAQTGDYMTVQITNRVKAEMTPGQGASLVRTRINVGQDEYGMLRRIAVYPYEEGELFEPHYYGDAIGVRIDGVKPSGKAFSYGLDDKWTHPDGSEGGRIIRYASTASVPVYIEPTRQMTAEAGDVRCQLRFFRNRNETGGEVGTATFIMHVEPSPLHEADISETELPEIFKLAREQMEAAARSAAAALASENAALASKNAAKASETATRASETAALSAKTAAETARGKAETAQSKAETAQAKAESAQAAAETAMLAAKTARSGAEVAWRGAEAAQAGAAVAEAGAESAQLAAETAQGRAETAQSKAETAQAKAESAQAAAEMAQGKAETAQGEAEEARDGSVEALAAACDTRDEIIKILENIYVCDGGTPGERSSAMWTIYGGTPATRAQGKAFSFDGGTPQTRTS